MDDTEIAIALKKLENKAFALLQKKPLTIQEFRAIHGGKSKLADGLTRLIMRKDVVLCNDGFLRINLPRTDME